MTHTPEKWYVWDDKVTGEDKVEIIAENIRDEKTAHQIKAIPDMLRALEAVCGESEESDYLTQAQIYGMCRSAIRKASGEE